MIIKNNIIFMGPPGVGKGTISDEVAHHSNLHHVSTGDIFREQIKNQTELGKKVQEIVQGGGYVPDEITNEIVKAKVMELNEKNELLILDGYPRTLAQAMYLDSLSTAPFVIFELKASDKTVLERLSGRRTCPNCKASYHIKFKPSSKGDVCQKCDTELVQRKDDQEDAIQKRLDIYNKQTAPLLDYYKSQNRLVVIEAEAFPEEILSSIFEFLKK
ncbi:nucleoside monophosphate kinase [Mycoplasma sp. Ms02]|uniref:adenylate kinase family protein n=1 Tax=Mycoplasma sp. Ms02 TaxID=353851 RepID=UPI001C8AD7BF|nr:nucleoside monophosphate kinase [Mycoplasma sp. Ms02]QZE12081.1 nucleoside monophosphate kinase [Mycoplasma sp. Ms02]